MRPKKLFEPTQLSFSDNLVYDRHHCTGVKNDLVQMQIHYRYNKHRIISSTELGGTQYPIEYNLN